ncbi:hypothetical protein IQ260_17000 [Leptolyngbya cf. ectocarpi LEGE 11479]|uniref:Uncharacterized protein n=1 Tax=Leptolyngbya cf. ectocarpi LEGE 11479 TaxID=1828722 RepID=A0A928ZVQ7_LEPEC|nr:hypothetical protein [Leptolyngbya ectocarpi]MBE9068352.1 hypothetical protein [Leptolyngbya cf. ectocarpi LEGE 11479]
MTFPNTPTVEPLLQFQGDTSISIYMPTHRGGSQVQQDPIRLRNLLGQIATELIKADIATEKINALLAPARELLEDSDFWQHQSDGLALFLGEDFFQYYQVPIDFDEFTSVSRNFYIKPLIPFWTNNGTYYVLAVSQNQVRVFEATRSSIKPLNVDSVPISLDEALKYDTLEKQFQFHISRSKGGSAVYRGQSAGEADNRTDIVRFLRAIDKGLKSSLTQTSRPMIFVGVDYLFPMYREINSYPTLLDRSVETNPDELNPQELHKWTWPFARDHFRQSLRQSKIRYLKLAGSPYTSDRLSDIINAAHDGQIETLFLTPGQQKWVIYDAQSRQFTEDDKADLRTDSLSNLAAIYTLHCGGQVFVTEPASMPANTMAAAILRYPMPQQVASVK